MVWTLVCLSATSASSLLWACEQCTRVLGFKCDMHTLLKKPLYWLQLAVWRWVSHWRDHIKVTEEFAPTRGIMCYKHMHVVFAISFTRIFFSIPWEPHFFIFYFYNYSCFLTPFEHVIVLWTVDMPLHIDTGHINILLNSLHVFWFFFKMHVYWNKLIVTTTVKCVII